MAPKIRTPLPSKFTRFSTVAFAAVPSAPSLNHFSEESMQRFSLHQRAAARSERPRPSQERLPLKGRFQIQHVRNGLLLATYDADNGVVDVGVNRIFNEYFRNGTSSSAFYLGIINNASFSALSASDTMASHA